VCTHLRQLLSALHWARRMPVVCHVGVNCWSPFNYQRCANSAGRAQASFQVHSSCQLLRAIGGSTRLQCHCCLRARLQAAVIQTCRMAAISAVREAAIACSH
jgi:hypothetical protein